MSGLPVPGITCLPVSGNLFERILNITGDEKGVIKRLFHHMTGMPVQIQQSEFPFTGQNGPDPIGRYSDKPLLQLLPIHY